MQIINFFPKKKKKRRRAFGIRTNNHKLKKVAKKVIPRTYKMKISVNNINKKLNQE